MTSLPKTAIIPMAGAGTRLRPFTYTQPKALIPVAGKPIIAYIIDDLIQAEINEFIFVIGYLGDKIVDYVEKNYPNLKYQFVYQNQRNGLGHAIYLCKDLIDINKPILIYLGDSIIDIPEDFFTSERCSLIATKRVSDPQNFGLVELDEVGKILKVVEKPKFPMSNLAIVGIYKINETALLFEVLEKINKDDIRINGEIQLTEALQLMLDRGTDFETFEATNWLDVGKGEILLKANATLLQKRGNQISPTAELVNSVVIPPCFIDKNAVILNSIIGPNVTIGSHTEVKNSIIEHGVLGDFSKLDSMQLTHFIIGSDSSLKGSLKSLNVGDNTEIDFSFNNS